MIDCLEQTVCDHQSKWVSVHVCAQLFAYLLPWSDTGVERAGSCDVTMDVFI